MENKIQNHPVLYECDEGGYLTLNEDRPIDEYISYRLYRAHETLEDATILANKQSWNSATNRLYYACFYMVSALLLKHGINTKSHSGTRTKFSEHFINTQIISNDLGHNYSMLFDNRLKGDYSDFFKMDQERFNRLYEPAKQLINVIEKLLKS